MTKISKSMNNVSLLILVTVVGITCATQEIIESLRATQNSYNGNRAGLSRYGINRASMASAQCWEGSNLCLKSHHK